MSDIQRETLSAGMDGELSKDEWRFLLRRLDHDAELMQAWTRYHVVRDGLRGQLTTVASVTFADKVMLAMEQGGGAHNRRRRWLHWSAGGAIAAGVAVAALIMTGPTGPGANSVAPPQVAATASPAVAPASEKVTSSRDVQLARSDAPAVVPPWVSAYSASQFSQGASFDPHWQGQALPTSHEQLLAYPLQQQRYSLVGNGDHGYLLLVYPSQQTPGSAAAR